MDGDIILLRLEGVSIMGKNSPNSVVMVLMFSMHTDWLVVGRDHSFMVDICIEVRNVEKHVIIHACVRMDVYLRDVPINLVKPTWDDSKPDLEL